MIILSDLQNNSSTKEQLEAFIAHHFQDIYDFFYNQIQIDLYQQKKEIKTYLQHSQKVITALDCSNKINGDFIVLMIETCEKLHLLMEFKLLYNYLSSSKYSIDKRLGATNHYYTIQKFTDYYTIYPVVLKLLQNAYEDEEDSKEILTATFINFYSSIIYHFGERNSENITLLTIRILTTYQQNKYTFLDDELIDKIFAIPIADDFKKSYDEINSILHNFLQVNNIISTLNNIIVIENSTYSNTLMEVTNITFNAIKQISQNYVKENIGNNEKDIHFSLQRGTKILEEDAELHQYIKSFGAMHKAKLYSSFDIVMDQLNNQKINVIDWGCGQALATSLLIDYIKERNIEIEISDTILIEPSAIALSRGLLHIDVLSDAKINITTINKDIDSLVEKDLKNFNQNITLHLFSNILDVEFFRLDRTFLNKIASSQNGMNYFICVSPNINDKRNARLDMFFRYFNENFETDLISSRANDVQNYKRYEKVFKVNLDNEIEVLTEPN